MPTPVDYDPFAEPSAAAPKGTPVDYDPFALDAGQWTGYTAPNLNRTDIVKGIGMGLAHGLTGVAGLPGDIDRMNSWLIGKGAETLGLLPEQATPEGGKRPGTVEDLMRAAEQMPMPSGGIPGDISIPWPGQAQIERGIGKITGPLSQYEPTTPQGQTAERLASFLPAGVGGLRTLISQAVIPAAASEAARVGGFGPGGQAAAAMAGSVLGHGAISATPAQDILAARTRGITDAEINAAEELQRRSPVKLSVPESLHETTGGKGSLTGAMRVIEGSPTTQADTQNYFIDRSQQIQRAANKFFDQVSPEGTLPSTLGTETQIASQAVLDKVRKTINKEADPYYAASANHLIGPDDFEAIEREPSFQYSLAKLRADKDLGPLFEKYPDNSIAVINEVTKDMQARASAMQNSSSGTEGFKPYASSRIGTAASAARDIARNPDLGGNLDYNRALQIEEEGRRQFLNPREAGPIGQMAATPKSPSQTNILYPNKPPPGSQMETSQAISDLEQQHPGLAAQLTRQHLEQNFGELAQANTPGANQWGGGKFIAGIMGNPYQRQTLEAGLAALPSRPDIQPLAEALRATGTRERVGSQTKFNELAPEQAMNKGSALGEAAATAASPKEWFSKVSDLYHRYRWGVNQQEIAKALMAPNMDAIRAARDAQVNLIHQLMAPPARSYVPYAAQYLGGQGQ